MPDQTRYYKTPRGRQGSTIFLINHRTIFGETFPRTKEAKAIVNKWDIIKHIFCIARENYQHKDNLLNKKIYANYMTNKELLPKVYKQFI